VNGSGRRYPERPVVGVGAFLFEDGRVLLIRRGKPPLEGCWTLPGGALEAGESTRDGACREVLEETGLTVEPLGEPLVFERMMRDDGGRVEYHFVLIDYVCRITGGTLRAASDASAAAWFAPQEMAELPLTPGTLEAIEQARKQRSHCE
jgi:8-oxo-dGTP diphosphatase